MRVLAKHNESVVLACFTLQGGGAERFVLTLAKAFDELGFQAHVVCFKRHVDYNLEEFSTIHFHFLNYQAYRWIPKGNIRSYLFCRSFDSYVKHHIGTPRLVLSNLYEVDSVLSHSKLPRVAHVIHSNTSSEFNLNSTARDTQLKRLQQTYKNHSVVCVSQGVMEDFKHHVHTQKPLTWIHNPIDRHAVQKESKSIPTDLPDSCAQGYIVHVGKFKPQKDHETLVRAYASSSQKLPLVLLGDGPLKLNTLELIQKLNITSRVVVLGFKSNPYPYIKHATGMAFSSVSEGFGLVVAEALSLEVPVVSTDCPHGPSEMLPKHHLVPVKNVDLLAAKLNQLMEHPKTFQHPFDEQLLPQNVAMKYLGFMSSHESTQTAQRRCPEA